MISALRMTSVSYKLFYAFLFIRIERDIWPY